MRRLKALYAAVFFILVSYQTIHADERDPLLPIGRVGARHLGLGGADIASPGTPESLAGNPASLVSISGPEVAAGCGFQDAGDQRQWYIFGASPVVGQLVFGFGFLKLQSPKDQFPDFDTALFSLGFPLSPNGQLVAGLTAKYLKQAIPGLGDTATGGGVDLGLLYHVFTTPEGMGLQLGAALLDAQTTMKTDNLELNLPNRFGVGAAFWIDPSRQITLDFNSQNSIIEQFESFQVVRFGLEQIFNLGANQTLASRLGYARRLDRTALFSAGVGTAFGDWQVDYAFQIPLTWSDAFHQISISWGYQRQSTEKIKTEKNSGEEKNKPLQESKKAVEQTFSALESAAQLDEKYALKEEAPKPTPTPEPAAEPSRDEEKADAYTYNLPIPEGPAGQDHASLGVAPEMPASFSSQFSGRRNAGGITISEQDLRLYVVVNPFSPNNDGRQDRTIFIGRLVSDRLRPVKWILTISRGSEVVQYFKGGSTLPRNLEWDGSNTKGKILPDGDYTAVLRIMDENSMELASASQIVTIRTQPKNYTLTGPGTKVLTGSAKDKPLNFGFVEVPGSSNWQFTVLNPSGQRVYQQSGSRAVPAKIEWNTRGQSRNILQGEYTAQMVFLDDVGIKTKAQAVFKIQFAEFEVALEAKPDLFKAKSQGGEGVSFQVSLDGELKIKSWRLNIQDEQEKTIMSYQGSGQPPETILWDGKLESGAEATPGSIYSGALTVVTALGAQSTVKTSKLQCDIGAYTGQKALSVNLVRVQFVEKSSELSPEAKQTLLAASKTLSSYQTDYQLEINGHCDKNEDPDKAIELSRARAQAVTDFLVAEVKIASERIRTVGRGSTKPLASGDSEEERSKNRRVEVVLYAK